MNVRRYEGRRVAAVQVGQYTKDVVLTSARNEAREVCHSNVLQLRPLTRAVRQISGLFRDPTTVAAINVSSSLRDQARQSNDRLGDSTLNNQYALVRVLCTLLHNRNTNNEGICLRVLSQFRNNARL